MSSKVSNYAYIISFAKLISLPYSTIPTTTSKREKIRQLLSEGNHSAKDIARIVRTTEAYVWKEKSKLKTAGFLI